MKIICMVLILAAVLCGCRAEETFETISDDIVSPVMAQPREISVRLPDNVVAPVLESDSEQIYICEEYEIILEKMDSGDLNATIQEMTGYNKEQLTVVQTVQDDADRYEFVWVSAGENCDRLGRGVILDDGSYHYCMSVLRDAEEIESTQIVWSDVFQSFSLTGT